MNSSIESLDRWRNTFLLLLGIIATIGVIMVYSSSYIFAKEAYGSSTHYFYRQLIYLIISVFIAYVISKSKITFWIKYGFVINLLATLLLLGTFIPGISSTVKGANRWIYFGPLGFQPGELVKFTLILSSVKFFEEFSFMESKTKLWYATTLLFPMGLLLFQPDFGSFSICFLVVAAVCYLSSFSRKYFYFSLGAGFLLTIPILISQPYRVRRLFAFLDPWKNAKTSGFQVIQSYLAFANGSVLGQGLGNSNEKLFYLPEAHNDFIFSVIGEELGFVGVFSVIALFVLLLFFGFRLCLKMRQRKPFILASVIIFTIGLQSLLNMGVVLGLLPTKGLNLPFISSGGSSLIANFFAIGLFLAAVRYEVKRRIFYNEQAMGADQAIMQGMSSPSTTSSERLQFPRRSPSRLP